jgi:glycolate oxidase FAD binding subunit
MLAGHGQCLPLDSSGGETATIGGLLATNDSGPLRHRVGTPRDLVIGIQLATVDGRLAKAGGRVVKNVAGYDLSRLICGSFGELAAIVGATFKLTPVPVSSATVVVERLDATAAGALAAALAASQLEPQAVEVHGRFGDEPAPSIGCLVRFAGFGAALDSQVAAAQALLTPLAPAVRVEAGDADATRWREYPASIWAAPGAVVRASWLPADLSRALELLQKLASQGPLELAGRAAIGAGTIRLGGDGIRQASAVVALRESGVFGNVVVLRADAALKAAVDVWGPRQNRPLLRAVKRAVDPGNTLGAGRGAV